MDTVKKALELAYERLPENDPFNEIVSSAIQDALAELEQPIPVARVITIWGYPDDSKHTVEWLVKHRELYHGQLLYAHPVKAPRPDSGAWTEDDERRMDVIGQNGPTGNIMETTAVVEIEQAEGMQIETVQITAGGAVVRRAYPESTRCCPVCFNEHLILLRTLHLKFCVDCATEIAWGWNQGRKYLLDIMAAVVYGENLVYPMVKSTKKWIRQVADDVDIAADLEEVERESAIAAARKALETPELRHVGKCHACDEPVPRPKLFCDSECAKDWQWWQDAVRRNHGRI